MIDKFNKKHATVVKKTCYYLVSVSFSDKISKFTNKKEMLEWIEKTKKKHINISKIQIAYEDKNNKILNILSNFSI